jgi:condensin complex subunit 1
MRMAIVEVIGNLIRELALTSDLTSATTTDPSADPSADPTTPANNTQTPQQTQKQLTSFYTLLLSRTLDLSSYVRTRTLTTLSSLLSLPPPAPKFPKHRLQITRAAIACLEDKAAGVRKAAVGVLVKLVVSHPYGLMHGGLLGLGEWEERYKGVKEELERVEGGVGDEGVVAVVEGEEGEGGDTEKEDDEGEDGSPKKYVRSLLF